MQTSSLMPVHVFHSFPPGWRKLTWNLLVSAGSVADVLPSLRFRWWWPRSPAAVAALRSVCCLAILSPQTRAACVPLLHFKLGHCCTLRHTPSQLTGFSL